MKMDRKGLTSGGLAKQAGVNLETVRFYERRAMLPKPPRTASGYRVFPPESVQRIRFIRRAQDLGFTLKEIKALLALSNAPVKNCGAVRGRAAQKIAEIEGKIAALTAMKNALEEISFACSGRNRAMVCPILESLGSDEEGCHAAS
jgi:MerR family transcriptional regulator, copper efflux regulator